MKLLKFCIFGLLIYVASCSTMVYAMLPAEKEEVLLTTSFKLKGGKQIFKAVYVASPSEYIDVTVSVSEGYIKFQPHVGEVFERSLGYVENRINETTVETVQYWLFEIANDTVGCNSQQVDNQMWYLNFLNNDTYEKEIHLEVTKVWTGHNYQNWF